MRKFLHELKDRVDSSSSQKPISSSSSNDAHSAALADRTLRYFYSEKNHQFQAHVKSESTLGAENDFGYVVWPVIIMLHCAAECLPPHQIHMTVEALQDYWNPQRHAFCAWKMFPGNEDIFFDDNCHSVQALLSAFQSTGQERYFDQAYDILHSFIMPSAARDGAIPWHINNDKSRAACSTGPAAVSALRMAAMRPNPNLVAFSERALNWLSSTLRDPEDGLIWDQLTYKDDGSTEINKMKWTYNTGFAVHGFSLLYEATKKEEYLRTATELAQSALNREAPLYDRSIPDPSQRYLSDGSFFLHHLVDGYVALSRHALQEELQHEIIRIANWGREFMYDPTDGLFFRGSVPYTISEDHTQRFNAKFASNRGLERNPQERDEHGNLCKTMIGCASWARIFRAAESV
ncbi:glycoside hydrolase family 76 protein [Rutstroemia sp. NJR-2017a BBW]|nr:glycoside hydrolase family 76 protein [Rutstroemia sp. NJR-2017a BBW]